MEIHKFGMGISVVAFLAATAFAIFTVQEKDDKIQTEINVLRMETRVILCTVRGIDPQICNERK